MTLFSIALSVLIGKLAVYRFGRLQSLQPVWASWMLTGGAGIATGIGLSGCLYFLLRFLLPASAASWLYLILRLAMVAALGYDCWRRSAVDTSVPARSLRFRFIPWLAIAFFLSLILVTYAMSIVWEANPQGNWDAWSIWNLRAKFLAAQGEGMAARAWSPILSFTHPEYPLLLSSFVAACWSDVGGTTSSAAPIATGYLMFLALLGMVTGGVAALRGPFSGLLAGLLLMGIPAFLLEVPAQCADVPLACFMAGAVLMALLERPILAGALAGFAAFTKDEGLLFVAVAIVIVAALRRNALLQFCLGALPVTALALVFKFVVARGTNSLLSGATGAKVLDPERIQTVVSAMLKEVLHWNAGWYHPLLPVVIVAITLRFDRRQTRDAMFGFSVAALMLLGYACVYVVTPNDLTWQLQTSLTRLFVQVCPLLLIGLFVALKGIEPEPAAMPIAAEPKKSKKARKGK